MNYDNLLELRGVTTKTQRATLEFFGLIISIIVWQLAALYVNKNSVLPSPFLPIWNGDSNPKTSVLMAIPEIWVSDLLLKNTLYSLFLNVSSYAIAIIIALPVGFAIGLSPIAHGLFNRPVDAIRFLPLTAVTGLFIAWFGIYTNMKIFFLAFGIIVYLVPVIVQRILEVEEVYIQTVQTLGATKWQTISKVFMPAALSRISDDIRVLTAISWTYIVVAELLNNEGGIGALTFRTSRQGRLDKTFLALAVIILLGICQDKIFSFIDKKMFKFKTT